MKTAAERAKDFSWGDGDIEWEGEPPTEKGFMAALRKLLRKFGEKPPE